MEKRVNKKGQELSIGTLILIVLGVIVLVLLVLGFSIGWENLFGKIGILGGSDLSAVVTSCKVAVSSQSKASYCEFKRVKIDGKLEYVNCEDSRVILDLVEKLDACPASAARNFCGTATTGKSADIKVNGQPCGTIRG